MNDWVQRARIKGRKTQLLLWNYFICKTLYSFMFFIRLLFYFKKNSNFRCMCLCVKFQGVVGLSVPMSLTMNPGKWCHLPINEEKCWVLKCWLWTWEGSQTDNTHSTIQNVHFSLGKIFEVKVKINRRRKIWTRRQSSPGFKLQLLTSSKDNN